jgi:hypothetical protein
MQSQNQIRELWTEVRRIGRGAVKLPTPNFKAVLDSVCQMHYRSIMKNDIFNDFRTPHHNCINDL